VRPEANNTEVLTMPLHICSRAGQPAVLLLAVGVLAACGTSAKKSASAATTPPGSAPAATGSAAALPAPLRSKGTLVVAADATYAPNEFIATDGHTVNGMDADLVRALGGVLGLKVDVVNANFASIIPGLAAGKYDLGASSFTDTREREKTVDFVTYFTAGTSFYTRSQGGSAIGALADLCGHTVAVESGTTQQTDAAAQDKKCRAAGKAAVSVLVFPDQNAANLALRSSRAQVGMADSPVAAYAVKQAGAEFKLVGSPYGTAPYGLAVPKGSGLAPPLLSALKTLIADGRYAAILARWGVGSGAISHPMINGATG
jgi:polar amino acid transport system substrate-binding protein